MSGVTFHLQKNGKPSDWVLKLVSKKVLNKFCLKTQPWWLGGRAYDQIQVGHHSCLGGFESRLGIISIV